MPSSDQVYNNAAAMTFDSATPGLNAVIGAWRALQDFTGNWQVDTYNRVLAATLNIRSTNLTH